MTDKRHKNASMYISALLFSLPNGTLIWFIIMYPVSGTTGETLHPYFHVLTVSVACITIFIWSLYDSENSSEVIYRTCRFGALIALLLPVTTGIISLFWAVDLIERPEAFLAGFSALEIPVHSAATAMILILLFLTGSWLASRGMKGIPF